MHFFVHCIFLIIKYNMNILYFPQQTENSSVNLRKTYRTLFPDDSNYIAYHDFFTDFSKIDLVLLPGGGDFDPAFSKKKDDSIIFKRLLDEKELYLLEEAKKKHLPILGICRGMQAILLSFQIPLVLHIENHRNTMHSAYLPNKKGVFINSNHHQGVYEAPGFDIFLRAEDDVIEGIRHPFYPIYGVQFHPEQMEKEKRAFLYDFLPVISR